VSPKHRAVDDEVKGLKSILQVLDAECVDYFKFRASLISLGFTDSEADEHVNEFVEYGIIKIVAGLVYCRRIKSRKKHVSGVIEAVVEYMQSLRNEGGLVCISYDELKNFGEVWLLKHVYDCI